MVVFEYLVSIVKKQSQLQDIIYQYSLCINLNLKLVQLFIKKIMYIWVFKQINYIVGFCKNLKLFKLQFEFHFLF